MLSKRQREKRIKKFFHLFLIVCFCRVVVLRCAPNLPRIPTFYTLMKIHKLTSVGRSIISGISGKLSAFVDKLLQPIAHQQKSYLKDTTDFINFMERTNVPENAILVSVDVMSLYTNIPQEEEIQTICLP